MQRPISYGSAAGVLRFNIKFRENFIYTLYTLINAEPCEIHSKITGVLIAYRSLPSISLEVLFGMAYGPTMRSQPSGLPKPHPLLEWNESTL